ncbi:MAG: transcriptional regulator, partial [Herbinix sp.]|nr:transcriptional regulator [Herbinix sp.]
MNISFDEYPIEDIKNGYCYHTDTKTYHCLVCGAVFEPGEIFRYGDRYYEAFRAIKLHVEQEHNGMFHRLLDSDSKYNSITDKQKELLGLIQQGLTDQEIASSLGISASTVRHQKFSFREKAKQAKLYLSLYELAMEAPPSGKDRLIPIHEGAKMVDDRYIVTIEEREKILATVFSSLSPLKLKIFSAKEKKKIVTLQKIMEQFEKGKIYPEKEVNQILKDIYDDYPTLRRYLIEYGFMDRS